MSLLSYNELCELVAQGVITDVLPGYINSASIDLTLGNTFILEEPDKNRVIDYRKREQMTNRTVTLYNDETLILKPGQFCLAQSRQVFHLPSNISGEYKLKSSMARIGLEHMNAGWCDAGWNGSVLTLEFKNMLQYQSIAIRPGDSIGQIVFFRHSEVPTEKSYKVRGRYNGDTTVKGIKE